jgi:hypothetical protein
MDDDNESTTTTCTTTTTTTTTARRHHHHHFVCSTSRIGVLEFAALLNATTTTTTTTPCEEEEEDGLSTRQWEVLWHARNILYALRRFIVTIRRDRYQATLTTTAATTTTMDDWYIRDVLDEDDFLLKNVPWLDKNQQQQQEEKDKCSTGMEEDEAIPMKSGNGFDGGRDTGNSSSSSLTQATTATTSTNDVRQEQPPQRAKKKKQRINHESWKDDIASYNVPFVGTSTRATYTTLATVSTTTTATTTGTIPPNVQMGVWPTGLLYDYLQKSPLAMELLRDDNTWMPLQPQSGGRSSTTNTTSPSQTRTPITTTWTNNSNNIHTLLWKQSRHGSNSNNNSSKKKKNKSSCSSDDTMERYGRALSQAIGKAYLQALSELITAALPPVQQQRCASLLPPPPHCIRNSSHTTTTTATPTTYLPTSQIPRFIPDLMTHRLSGLLQLLVDDTGLPGMRTAGTNSNQDHFHIRPTGVWVAPILTICTRLASISVPIARQIARCMEQTLPQPIVRYLFTYPPPSSSSSSSPSVLQETNHPHPSAPEQPSNNHTPVVTRVVSPRMKAYVAAIHFLTTLVDIDDSVIFSCISSNNSHTGSNAEHTHTKQQQPPKPTKSGGILFWALQRGLPATTMTYDDDNSNNNNTYDAKSEPLYAMTQLLQAVRHLLLNHQKSISTATNKRWLMELFSRECIQQVCDLTTGWAPPLQNYKELVGSIHASNGNDSEDTATTANDMHHHVMVGIEARRLLFLLLVDIHHSPLLRVLHDTKTNHRSSSFESTVVQVILVKALIHLVLHSNHDTSILEVHRFVLYVVNLSPTLLPTLLRMVPIPVDDSKRRPFIVLSRLSLMSTLLRYGPRAIHCFDVTTKLTECNQESVHDDTIVLTVLPMAIKKQILVKLLQNTNSLIVLEAFKLLVIIIRRCRDYFLDLEHLHNAVLETKVVNMIALALPDLPTLTLVVSKLSATIQDDKSKIILLTWACEALQAYRSVFTRTTLGSTSVLDVSKLLPISAKMFLSSPTVVQRTILSIIKHFITIQEVNVFMFCCMLNFQTLYTLALTHNDALPQIYMCSPARISNLRY